MKLDTGLPADSVEYCPHPDALQICVCGTYQLSQANTAVGSVAESDNELALPSSATQKRLGKCLVYEASRDAGLGDNLTLLEEISMPAVLDMKWSYSRSALGPLLGIADAEGHISLQRWSITKRRMECVQEFECRPSTVLCLSLDWSNRIHTTTYEFETYCP